MGFAPDFGEPPRKESPGEARQRLADLAVMAVRLFLHTDLSPKERDAVVTLLGVFHRIAKSAKE
jgi:hypothetical protein